MGSTSYPLIFSKCHDVFLHIQASWVDYEENSLHSLRHYKIDKTLAWSLILSLPQAAAIGAPANPTTAERIEVLVIARNMQLEDKGIA